MSKKILSPKGRRSIPNELLQFGRHLVYSEGTKTEPNYVENIKGLIAKKYNCRQNDIEIINANRDKSYSTIGLVNVMKDDVKRRLSNDEVINHVWVFFDKDDFEFQAYKDAINALNNLNDSEDTNEDSFKYNKKDGISYHACYSNESFELWLLSYFSLYSSILNRNDYITKLNEKIKKYDKTKKYDKNIKNIHDLLVNCGGTIENAINNAEKLTNNNGIDNPSTTVYIFAKYFLAYMKQ